MSAGMATHMSAFLSSFLLSLLLTPLAILIARRSGLVDAPDASSSLKIHNMPVPNSGGLAVALSVLPTVLVFMHFNSSPIQQVFAISGGCLLSLTLGVVDDVKGLRPLTRLFTQIALAVGLVIAGIHANLFPSGLLNAALTVLIVVGAINSINLLDGMDGLASGVMAISCTAFALLSYVRGDSLVVALALAMVAALIGFLPYNFHPASVFLGNGGSSLLGFLLAVLITLVLSRTPTPAGLAGCLLIAGLPLIDTAYAIVRRIKAGRGLMSGDRDHFYDKLLRRGFSQRQAAFISYTAATVFAASGLAVSLLEVIP
ncbi:MAG: putative undecaprenyl-phosphate N-acetylglucosaminyl 1-phosphate transferase [Syntrophorhabdaceae bacterium PtaU1.Bin034]|nr:MAG: putative undecaprenyl-phosphate N-acetylglucosaminyl 1-phosphate transferase [Syntrophorhabdaceae bacterium PtaU1.Bin034]